jgi:hypothetical protein
LLHDACPLLDELAKTCDEFVWQHIGDPDKPATARTLGKDL